MSAARPKPNDRADFPARGLTKAGKAAPPRLALRRSEAAAALGISDEVFDTHVRPELPVVRLASVKVYPMGGIEAWLAKATSPAEDTG